MHCSAGARGKSTAIIVDPRAEQIIQFLVQTEGSQYLVPVEAITDSTADRIQLRWSRQELVAAAASVNWRTGPVCHEWPLSAPFWVCCCAPGRC